MYIDDALAIFWNKSWVKDIPCVGFCGLPTCLFPPHFVLILGLEVLLGAFLSINLLENRPMAGFFKRPHTIRVSGILDGGYNIPSLTTREI